MSQDLTPPRPKFGWVPWSLLALSFVPAAAGLVRLITLARGATLTPENARFIEAPIPVILHILGVLPFTVLGAFQFSAPFRARNPRWHRLVGRLLVPCGLVAAFSGLWMTVYYPLPLKLQGPLLFDVRVVVAACMSLFLLLGLRAILQRKFSQHSAWMIRAYALGQGAGTQVITLLPVALIVGEPLYFERDVLMVLAWAINAALAEWIILRNKR